MYQFQTIRHVALQDGDGRHLRYVLQPNDLPQNDPFILLADDKFAHNTFADHPHKGIQTVTYVLEGSLTHYDSKTGGGGRLQQGDFQIMTAGRGIIHNENPDEDQEVRVLQLWVNLSSAHKKVDGMYEDLVAADVPIETFKGGSIRVFAGELNGIRSPLTQYTPFHYVAIQLQAGASYELTIPAGLNTYLYNLQGVVEANTQVIHPFDVAHYGVNAEQEVLTFTAKEEAAFVVFAGEPIQEPIVAQGPFVMNTQQEINEAFEAYRNGTFLDGTPY